MTLMFESIRRSKAISLRFRLAAFNILILGEDLRNVHSKLTIGLFEMLIKCSFLKFVRESNPMIVILLLLTSDL